MILCFNQRNPKNSLLSVFFIVLLPSSTFFRRISVSLLYLHIVRCQSVGAYERTSCLEHQLGSSPTVCESASVDAPDAPRNENALVRVVPEPPTPDEREPFRKY